MEIILIERQVGLGNVGDIVKVKNGYARNYLFPNKKAIVADESNKQEFAARKAEIEKEFSLKASAAEDIKSKIDSKVVILIKQAGKDDRLYGSVTSTDIVSAIREELSVDLPRSVVRLTSQIKSLGRHIVSLNIFSDVYANITILIARSQEEAQQELERVAAKAAKEEVAVVLEELIEAPEDFMELENQEATQDSKEVKTSKAKRKPKNTGE